MNYILHDTDRDGWGSAALLVAELRPETCQLFPVRDKDVTAILRTIGPRQGDAIWILDIPAPESWGDFPSIGGGRVVWIDHHLESWGKGPHPQFELMLPETGEPTTTMSMLVNREVVRFEGARRFVRSVCARDQESEWPLVFDGLAVTKRFPVSIDELPALLALAPTGAPVPPSLRAMTTLAESNARSVKMLLKNARVEPARFSVVIHLDDAHGIPLRQYSLAAAARHPGKVVVVVHRSTLIYCGRDSSQAGLDLLRHFKFRGLVPRGHGYVAYVTVTTEQVRGELNALEDALKQRHQLERAIENATIVRTKLQGLLEKYGERVHFRPSASGISMIGLLPESPQRGSGALPSLEQVEENFESLFEKHCISKEQGRRTREKELQSHLIRESYKNGRMMKPLNVASQNTENPVELIFITDEIALPKGDGKVVCDVLALRHDPQLGAIPVLLELKDRRLLTRLEAQVVEFARLMDLHAELFAELYTALLGKPVRFGAKTEKWVVWPSGGRDVNAREAKFAEKGIRVVCYDQKGDQFSFAVGNAP